MNLYNLKVGNVYKNYPALCSALGESVKTNNSKKAQLKEWSRFFEWERIGHKYKITKIYGTPKPKEQGRKKSSKYATAAYDILIQEMRQKEYSKFFTSKLRLIELFGFSIRFRDEDVCKTNFGKRMYYKFRKDCTTAQYDIVNRILDNLVKLKKIKCVERFNIIPNGKTERIANKAEEKIIREAREITLRNMDCESVFYVYLQGLEKQFAEKINEILSKHGFIYDKTLLEISLCDDKGMQRLIDNAYRECFTDMSQDSISCHINQQRRVLHDLCKRRIQTRNNRVIEKIRTFQYIPDDSEKEYKYGLLDEWANICIQMQKSFFENFIEM